MGFLHHKNQEFKIRAHVQPVHRFQRNFYQLRTDETKMETCQWPTGETFTLCPSTTHFEKPECTTQIAQPLECCCQAGSFIPKNISLFLMFSIILLCLWTHESSSLETGQEVVFPLYSKQSKGGKGKA